MRKTYVVVILSLFAAISTHAQINIGDKVTLSGSLQTDILFPQEDEAINTGTYSDKILTNTYLDLNLRSKYVSAGARFEYLQFPLPGFEPDFKGWGVPYFYVQGRYKNVELTAGDFYDQFGSGFIFRTYEERSLGIDNSLRGARLVFQPYKGINVKMLGGKQRRYWDHNDSWVWGADAEFDLDQWFSKMQEKQWYLMVGASYVGKHEKDQNIYFYPEADENFKRLNLPLTVGAFDVRARLQKGNYSFLAEFALKGNDPSEDNGYIYKNGTATMLSGSYSKKGLSVLLQAKRSDNMSFRSRRDMQGISSFINNLPAFAMQHTYALATIYPYATQPKGEWAFQGEVSYNFKRKTPLGGKYGTTVKLNASHIRSTDRQEIPGTGLMGTEEYSSKFFKMGPQTFYQDINASIEKKLTKSLKLNFMYMNQRFNPVIVGHNEDMLTSNIFILEGKYQFNNKLTLRGEFQYLLCSDYTGNESNVLERSNQGDWMFGLLELSVAPSLMFTISDMYNNGETKEHYYMGSVVFVHKSHRLMVGYGRTRAGYNCSGGVCRMVPASKGVQLSYNFNF